VDRAAEIFLATFAALLTILHNGRAGSSEKFETVCNRMNNLSRIPPELREHFFRREMWYRDQYILPTFPYSQERKARTVLVKDNKDTSRVYAR
jgi:hypothetical protein